MINYYCKECKKVCTRDEVDLVEGDWQEVHLACGEKVICF